MAKIPSYDPMTSNAKSPLIAGLTEACNKISSILDMKTSSFEDLQMSEVFIAADDRFRIYQVPANNRLWLGSPYPIIKKNGVEITPGKDHFSIDYVGGSISFEEEYVLTDSDVVTATASYIVDGSNKLEQITTQLTQISEAAEANKGSFNSVADLESAVPSGEPGDFAIISNESAIYIWSTKENKWVPADQPIDLTDYYTQEEITELLKLKQDFISPYNATEGQSASDYFYAGDKSWVNLSNSIGTFKLSNLAPSAVVPGENVPLIANTDTLLQALRKLQDQIISFLHPIIGTNEPTTSTVGAIGQDYINISNGNKYRLVSISEDNEYTWTIYGRSSCQLFQKTLDDWALVQAQSNILDIVKQYTTEITVPISNGFALAWAVTSNDVFSYYDYDLKMLDYNNNIIVFQTVTPSDGDAPPPIAVCILLIDDPLFSKMDSDARVSLIPPSISSYYQIQSLVTSVNGAILNIDDGLSLDISNSRSIIDFSQEGISVNGTPVAQVGADGKSAYEQAVEGGYTGTEDEFNQIIASGPWFPITYDPNNLPGPDVDLANLDLVTTAPLRFYGEFDGESSSLQLDSSHIAFSASATNDTVVIESNINPENNSLLGIKLSMANSPEFPTIGNIGAPTDENDVANKIYVDDSIKAAVNDAILASWAASY